MIYAKCIDTTFTNALSIGRIYIIKMRDNNSKYFDVLINDEWEGFFKDRFQLVKIDSSVVI